MRKIGREVLFMSANNVSRRKGEGDFIRLKDGTIMHAYSEYLGADAFDDHHYSRVVAIFSHDEGETWGEHTSLIETEKEYMNTMSVSLLRFKNGDIGLFYCKKYMNEKGAIKVRIFVSRSKDECKTFGEPYMISEGEYMYSANSRAILTKAGRVILAVNCHKSEDGINVAFASDSRFYLSDDDGYTFYDSGNIILGPYNNAGAGLQETGIVEIENGRILAYARTTFGCQYIYHSDDGGLTWTEPKANSIFFSPGAPMLIRHVCKNKTLAVFNPIPNYPGRKDDQHEWSRRTPMIGMICDGEGENLLNGKNIPLVFEDDDWNSYCYPAIISGDDYFLIAYYHSNNTKLTLNSLKMIKVELKDIYPEEEKKD